MRHRAERLLERELQTFEQTHPRSRALSERARSSLLAGVPMHWMLRWAGGFPVYAERAWDARFRVGDGVE